MPGTTPVFGFPYPTGTDRVADGDNAIQDLAEAVEAELQTGTTSTAVVFATNCTDNATLGGTAIFRVGPMGLLKLGFNVVTATIAFNGLLMTLPAGWRPGTGKQYGGSVFLSGGAAGMVGVYLEPDGELRVASSGGMAVGNAYNGSVLYWIEA